MRKGKLIWILVVLGLLIVGISVFLIISSLNKNKDNEGNNNSGAGLANPASVYCQQQGYDLEIRADEQGNQYGVCIFPDGSECEEWVYYRGECEIGDSLI